MNIRTIPVVFIILNLFLLSLAFAEALPDTGQITCYNNTEEIICPQPGEPFHGQDANYAPCNPDSYVLLDGDLMVQDNLTGLVWQRDTAPDICNWEESFDYCENLTLGGYSDWRLPTVKELYSLVRSNIPFPNPTINTDYFPDTEPSYYWSSTTHADDPYFAWHVNFYSGSVDSYHKSGYRYVRAVRDGESGSPSNFIDNGDGTVTDKNTDLLWQKDTAPGIYTWKQALSYCENLTLAESNDWRLPNKNELQSILDYSRYEPSLDPIFPNTVSSYYWSSTTDTNSPNYAWSVGFGSGVVSSIGKSWGIYVRAVSGGKCGLFVDADGDAINDYWDNCPYTPNGPDLGTCTSGVVGELCMSDGECGENGYCSMNQEDTDEDEVGDVCDNCPDIINPDQADMDGDELGDVCDPDNDNDSIPDDGDNSGIPGDYTCTGGETENCDDNCRYDFNPEQEDPDGDGVGDMCDNCPNDYNPFQEDVDLDVVGDVCDNCPDHPNGPMRGTCTEFTGGNYIVSNGQYCTDDGDCDEGEYCEKSQADHYPPEGNGIGDACDCEGDFNCSGGVDAGDVGPFLDDWNKRTIYSNPCTNEDPCEGDFNCSRGVDAGDVGKFLEDWNKRTIYSNPCPPCTGEPWCIYP